MAFYEWTDRLAIGDEVIDRQHRVLILAEAMERKKEQQAKLVALVRE